MGRFFFLSFSLFKTKRACLHEGERQGVPTSPHTAAVSQQLPLIFPPQFTRRPPSLFISMRAARQGYMYLSPALYLLLRPLTHRCTLPRSRRVADATVVVHLLLSLEFPRAFFFFFPVRIIQPSQIIPHTSLPPQVCLPWTFSNNFFFAHKRTSQYPVLHVSTIAWFNTALLSLFLQFGLFPRRRSVELSSESLHSPVIDHN